MALIFIFIGLTFATGQHAIQNASKTPCVKSAQVETRTNP